MADDLSSPFCFGATAGDEACGVARVSCDDWSLGASWSEAFVEAWFTGDSWAEASGAAWLSGASLADASAEAWSLGDASLAPAGPLCLLAASSWTGAASSSPRFDARGATAGLSCSAAMSSTRPGCHADFGRTVRGSIDITCDSDRAPSSSPRPAALWQLACTRSSTSIIPPKTKVAGEMMRGSSLRRP